MWYDIKLDKLNSVVYVVPKNISGIKVIKLLTKSTNYYGLKGYYGEVVLLFSPRDNKAPTNKQFLQFIITL